MDAQLSHRESDFRRLLAPVADAINAGEDIDLLHDALAELRRVESMANLRVVQLAVGSFTCGGAGTEADQILNTQETSAHLGRSVNWINHHRGALRPALATAPGSRPRYSKRRLDQLLRTWNSNEGRCV